jgi:DnaJ homolog subfamily C member 8
MTDTNDNDTTNNDNDNGDNDDDDDGWQVQRDAHKAVGDAAFRSSQFAQAIHHYTTALALDPTNHILLSNRSAAYLQHGNMVSRALHDAQACVAADPAFAKGYSRLGAALQALGRWGPAKEAYDKVLTMDASNAAARKGLTDCDHKLMELQQQQQQQQQPTSTTGSTTSKATGDDDDLLDDFFDDLEAVTTTTAIEAPTSPGALAATPKLSKHNNIGTAATQIERLLAPNHKWRNLNPFHVLDLPHTCTKEDISKRYKAISLLLHPDKCTLPQSTEAFAEIQRAKLQLDDEDKHRHVCALIAEGIKLGAEAFAKQKDTTAMKPTTSTATATDDIMTLEELQMRETQRIFAQVEFKRIEVEERERKNERRERDQEELEVQKERKERAFDKSWRQEERVGKRVGNWRDFEKETKKKGKTMGS